jgi:hypothetical protein
MEVPLQPPLAMRLRWEEVAQATCSGAAAAGRRAKIMKTACSIDWRRKAARHILAAQRQREAWLRWSRIVGFGASLRWRPSYYVVGRNRKVL